MLVNSMWVSRVEAMAIEEENHLNPHAARSTAEFKIRAKHYGVSLDWSLKKVEMEKKDLAKFNDLADSLKI